MFTKSLIITSLLISSSFSLKLDENKAKNDNLTLEKVIELSLLNDPWLLKNKYSQKALDYRSISAGTLPDPKISITLASLPTDTFELNQEAMTQVKIGVSQMFPRGNTLEIKQNKLKVQASAYPFQREDRKAKLTLKISSLFLDAYKAQESINLIQKNRFLFEQLVDIAESSYSTAIGKTRQQDILRAQLQLTKLDDKLTILKQKKEKAMVSLSQWLYDFENEDELNENIIKSLNTQLDKELPKIRIINKNIYEKNIQSQILLDLFKEHPSVKNLDKKIKATFTEVQLAKQGYKPQFAFSASYGYRQDSKSGMERADLLSAGISFDIPLFTENRQDKEVEAAKLKTKAARMDRLLKLRELLSSYESTKSSLKRLFKREKLYKEELLPQIHEQAEATLTAYTNDDGSFADVSRSRIAQLNAKIVALSISVEIKKNIVKLNYLFAKNNKNILNIQGDNK